MSQLLRTKPFICTCVGQWHGGTEMHGRGQRTTGLGLRNDIRAHGREVVGLVMSQQPDKRDPQPFGVQSVACEIYIYSMPLFSILHGDVWTVELLTEWQSMFLIPWSPLPNQTIRFFRSPISSLKSFYVMDFRSCPTEKFEWGWLWVHSVMDVALHALNWVS